MTILIFLLVATASLVTAQDKLAAASLKPIAIDPVLIPHPPVCLITAQLTADTAADTEPAQPEFDTAAAAAESLTIFPWPPVRRCEDGPVRKLLAPANTFYWPPIYQGSCDNLYCKDPPCIARLKVWRTRCVLVYKYIRGCWRKIGFRPVRYQDHLKCGCKECRDIPDKKTCVETKPCPNGNHKESFCYWKGTCDCCVPTPCPNPKIFDRDSCSCVCPPGSSPVGDKCVGDCSDVSLNHCPSVMCRDNKHFNCKVEHYKCVCPSCDKASDPLWCRKTKCLEQPMKPMCVYDYNRCRCPRCEDQTDKIWCEKTSCGPYNQQVCKFDQYYNKCTCPPY